MVKMWVYRAVMLMNCNLVERLERFRDKEVDNKTIWSAYELYSFLRMMCVV